MRILSLVLVNILVISLGVNGLKELRNFKNSQLFIDNDRVKLISNDDQVNYFVIGDWGGLPLFPYRTPIEQSASQLMTRLAKKYDTKFQLALGDNFYTTGVVDVDDKRFKQTYEDVFTSDYLRNTSWFMILGNHDHYGNATAQVEYTKKSHRWILPSLNYTLDVKINDGQTDLVSFIMIDTVTLCGNTGYDWEDKTPRFFTKLDKLKSEAYLRSLEENLKRAADSDVPYLIVTGHFPVWSIAEHGPTKCLVDKVRPLLHKYKVSAYMCGHDHNLQHLQDTYLNQTVDYIVTGASNFIDNKFPHINDVPPNSLKFHWADDSEIINGGFIVVQTTTQSMTITFYETTGKELYQTTILPRQQV